MTFATFNLIGLHQLAPFQRRPIEVSIDSICSERQDKSRCAATDKCQGWRDHSTYRERRITRPGKHEKLHPRE